MVEELRVWWRTHQNPTLLFPTPGRGWADRTFTLSQSMNLILLKNLWLFF
jgi:hypothetical protein